MKTLAILSVVAAIFSLTMTELCYAETAQTCASNCVSKCSPLGSGKEYATCLENCIKGCYDKGTDVPPVPAPTPVTPSKSQSDLNGPKLCAETCTEKADTSENIVVASASTDKDLPCYVGGKMAGYCSRLLPYLHVFSDTCHSTLQDCKKKDGDLASVPGSGGCVRCGK